MAKMTVYHGGYISVENPQVRIGRNTKDFGTGFYCTVIKEQAQRWAKRYDTKVVSIYEVRLNLDLNIKEFQEMTEEWLDFIIDCRSGKSHNYDIVIGAMADDQIYNYISAVLIPSVLFGLVHIIGMDFSIISSLLVLIAGTMVGIMFSMVAIESGSVWNSGIVHSLWNILIIGGGLSISEKADEYSVMTYVLDSKDFVFTGGEFGIESSIIALLGYVIVTLAAICMIKKKAKV